MNRLLLISAFIILPLLATAQQQRTTNWENGTLNSKGDKAGVWEYFSYSPSGERVVTQRYDHTKRKLIYSRTDDKFYQVEIKSGHWEATQLTRAPWFVGGHEALAAYTSKLDYPAAAQAGNVEGRVVVSFIIDTLGRASSYQIVQGIGSGCDEEALRVSRTVPGYWLPGRLGSHAVPVRYELPFTFRLQ
jgi:protein TonB